MQNLITKEVKLKMIPWLFIGIVGSLLTLGIPYLVQSLLDNGDGKNIFQNVMLIVALLFIQLVFSFSAHYGLLKIGENIVLDFRMKAYESVLQNEQEAQKRSGESAGEIIEVSKKLKNFIVFQLPTFIQSIVTIVGILIFLFILNWKLSVVILLGIPSIFLFLIPMSKLVSNISQSEQKVTIKVIGQLGEYFRNRTFFLANNATEQSKQKMKESYLELYQQSVKLGFFEALMQPFSLFFITIVLSFIFLFGGLLLSSGEMTIGTFISFLIYIFMLLTPASSAASFLGELSKLQGSMSDLLELIRKPITAQQNTGEVIDLSDATIQLSDVSFGYEDTEVLKHISMEIHSGSTVAIVGPSGAGKSTLLSLLLGMIQPTNGQVCIDSIDLSGVNLQEYRNQIGYLAQNETLLAGTILDNLTWGLKGTVSTEAINQALKDAEIYDFVSALPQGIHTNVSELGDNFSGGQQQRLAFARILLRNPKLIFLDEATSSLDSILEHKIIQTLEQEYRHLTKVMIAHRLSTVQDATQIYFLEDGKITGVGTHSELLESHPHYQEFVKKQMIHQ